MNSLRVFRRSAAAALSTVLLAGCGVQGQMEPVAQIVPVVRPVLDLSLFDQGRPAVDYEPSPSPSALAAHSDIVLRGSFVDLKGGPSWIYPFSGFDLTSENHMILKLKIEKIYKGRDIGDAGDFVYVRTTRGSNSLNFDGTMAGPDIYPTVDQIKATIPVGTPVILMGQIARWGPAKRYFHLVNPHAGYPEGGVLLGGGIQGLNIDAGPGVPIYEWGGGSYDDVRAAVDRLS